MPATAVPVTCRIPPLKTTGPRVERLSLADMLNSPAASVVPPVYVLLPVSVKIPRTACVKLPEPAIAPPNVGVPERLKTSALLSVTGPAPKAPEAPPLPTCSVPPVIVVRPVYVHRAGQREHAGAELDQGGAGSIVAQHAGVGCAGIVGTYRQGDGRAGGIREDQVAAAGQAAEGSGHETTKAQRTGAAYIQGTILDRQAAAQGERSPADERVARVDVRGGEGQHARTSLRQTAAAADDIGHGKHVGRIGDVKAAIECSPVDRRVVPDAGNGRSGDLQDSAVENDRTARGKTGAGGNAQFARGQRCAARVGVAARKRQYPRASLCQLPEPVIAPPNVGRRRG